jgi:hypothetical protein
VFNAHDAHRRDRMVELVDALSDTPVTTETHAWFIGHARNAAVLARRLAGLMPDAQPITRSEHMAACASRRHSATTVYWLDDGALELTLDDDLDQAIATIRNDIACADASVARTTAAERTPADRGLASKRYGRAVSEPVLRASSPSRTRRPDRARRAG